MVVVYRKQPCLALLTDSMAGHVINMLYTYLLNRDMFCINIYTLSYSGRGKGIWHPEKNAMLHCLTYITMQSQCFVLDNKITKNICT